MYKGCYETVVIQVLHLAYHDQKVYTTILYNTDLPR